MEKGLLNLGDWEAISERRSFLMVETKEVIDKKGLIEVLIPDNPLIAHEKTSRRILERGNKKWRWPAGGCAIILKLKDSQVLLTVQKDSGAPSYAGHDTIGAGLGSSTAEILYPLRTAIREGIEEIIIQTPSGVVCPSMMIDPFGFSLEIRETVRDSISLFSETRGLNLIQAPVSFIDLPGQKTVEIDWRGMKANCQALVNFDQGVNGIDLLAAVQIDVDCCLDDLSLFDGEVMGGNPINRVVNAYELENLKPTGRIIASWQKGTRIKCDEGVFPHPFIPHTRDIMEALSRV